MKLKELPPSIYHSLRLRSIPGGTLIHRAGDQADVIVTLTSIPQRLSTLDIVIRSLLTQQTMPWKILLWLPHSLRDSIPSRLQSLVHERFEIRFTPLTCPHKKLIHSLEAYPDKVIVTCDDDLIYRSDWLQGLIVAHGDHPRAVIGHQLRYIRQGADGQPLPYREWILPANSPPDPRAALAIGAGGVLYPPHSLDPRVQNRELFLELCPRADDLWFKMMGLLAGTGTKGTGGPKRPPIPIIGTQRYSLKKGNISRDENRLQWIALQEYFNMPPAQFS